MRSSNRTRGTQAKKNKLENMAIVNALQLEAARRRSVPIRFEVAQHIRCRLKAFLLLIRYAVTLNFDPVTLTFDLEHL